MQKEERGRSRRKGGELSKKGAARGGGVGGRNARVYLATQVAPDPSSILRNRVGYFAFSNYY